MSMTTYITNQNGTYDTGRGSIYGDNWAAQSFKVLDNFKIQAVSLKMGKILLPGQMVVSIREVSGGVPVGDDLCLGRFEANHLYSGTPGDTEEIRFNLPVELFPMRTYAVVIRALHGDASNLVVWGSSSSSEYANGEAITSSDAGDTWSAQTYDFWFDILGNSPRMVVGTTLLGKNYGQSLKKAIAFKTEVVRYDTSREQRNQVWRRPVRSYMLPYKHLSSTVRDNMLSFMHKAKGSFYDLAFEDPYDNDGTCSFTQVAIPVTAVSQVNKTFTLAGRYDSAFVVDENIAVDGSTGNDGGYVITDISYDSDDDETTVEVYSAISDATADGSILKLDFQLHKWYDTDEVGEFLEVKNTIQASSVTVEVNSVEQTEGTDYWVDYARGLIMFEVAPSDGDVIEVTYSFYYRVRQMQDTMEISRMTDQFWDLAAGIGLIEVKLNGASGLL